MEDEGFTNVVYEKEFSDEPSGTVLSIVPEQGTRAKSAQEIIVRVAEPYVVPETAGKSLGEAQTEIEHAGLTYDYEYVNTVDYPEGTILGSYPEAGTEVKSNTVLCSKSLGRVASSSKASRGPIWLLATAWQSGSTTPLSNRLIRLSTSETTRWLTP